MSRLKAFWSNYKVLIVMGSGLAFIHWGWYAIKSNPLLRQNRNEYTPEPGIVTYVSPTSAALPPLPESARKKKEVNSADEASK